MKAVYLIKNGDAKRAFELRDHKVESPGEGELLINVESFGLNYADVMARNGIYKDAPPLPAVLGYETVGRVEAVGSGANDFKKGDRVLAFTQFGGYAQQCVADSRTTVKLPDSISNSAGVALATQYCTAYYAAIRMANIQPHERVLIHACAGGVGIALTQLAKWVGCEVVGTAGSDQKIEFLKEQGIDYPINYRKEDFATSVRAKLGEHPVDVIFDPIGGKTFKNGNKLVRFGGRHIIFGVSTWSGSKGNVFDKLKLAWDFGLMHPLQFLLKSNGVIGLNMLRIAEQSPSVLGDVMQKVVDLADQNILKPHIGGEFTAKEIADAHHLLESRNSIGKVVLNW